MSFVYSEGDIEKLTDKGKRNIEVISEKIYILIQVLMVNLIKFN